MQISEETRIKITKNLSFLFPPEGFKLTIEKLSGGLNNFVYKVSPSNGAELPPVIYKELRLDPTVNVAKETSIIKNLSALGLAHKLLFFDPDQNFRVEEFVDGRLIEQEEFENPLIVLKLIETIVRLHAVDPSLTASSIDYIEEIIEGAQVPHSREICERKAEHFAPNCWEKVDAIKSLFEEKEISFLRLLRKKLSGHELVFSHNDIASGNVILEKKTGRIFLLDWETAFMNFRAFDVASIWAENFILYDSQLPFGFQVNPSMDVDWSQINSLLSMYLTESRKIDFNKNNTFNEKQEKTKNETNKKIEANENNFDKEMSDLMEEFKFSVLLIFYNASAWGVSVVDQQTTELNYLEWAFVNFGVYQFFKEKFYGENLKSDLTKF